ncbi:hypothetical protein BDV96DRAFT_650378 [Lophiotrema nucula]|uniref:MYND-type domain-containing protein n=1 Tax=Lophiotrema nucula TaxID=690887 RepID=A0A6A5YVN0_9PLEO|nr:hypothetical protein BDV96DRAFT_650378 [Lophiotrema nucula]
MPRTVETRCSVCYREPGETPFNVCGGCMSRRYCSRACQKADWRVLKHECGRATEAVEAGETRTGEPVGDSFAYNVWEFEWEADWINIPGRPRDAAGVAKANKEDMVYYLEVTKAWKAEKPDILGPFWPAKKDLERAIMSQCAKHDTIFGLRGIPSLFEFRAPMMGKNSAMLIIHIRHHSAPELIKKLKVTLENVQVPVFLNMKISYATTEGEKGKLKTITMDAKPEASFISLDAANNHAKGLLDKWTKELRGSKTEVSYE